MGTVANALNLLFILSSGKTYKIKELAEKLEVSNKSIRVYRDSLDSAGIFILEKRGKHGGYYLPRDLHNTLLGLEISEEEMIALEIVSGELESKDHIEAKNIQHILRKIKLASEKRQLNQQPPDYHISHISGGSKPNIKKDFEREKLLKVLLAKKNKKKVKMKYKSLQGETTTRVIHIYNTYTYRSEMYIVAYCELRKKVRDFKLRRASELEILKDHFDEVNFSMSEHIKNCIGIFKGDPIQVKIVIKEPLAQIVREKIYSDDQKITELEEGIIFEATMRGKEEIISWILSMGECAKLMAPDSLKEELIGALNRTLANYGS